MKFIDRILGKAEPKPAVTATLRRENDNIYVIRIGGLLNKETVNNIEAVARRDIDSGARGLKVLLILQNDFLGWQRTGNWGDVDFFRSMGIILRRSPLSATRSGKNKYSPFWVPVAARGRFVYFRREKIRRRVFGWSRNKEIATLISLSGLQRVETVSLFERGLEKGRSQCPVQQDSTSYRSKLTLSFGLFFLISSIVHAGLSIP